jgi:hypothetical protein
MLTDRYGLALSTMSSTAAPVGLLRGGRERPRDRRTAEKRDELAPTRRTRLRNA